MPKVDTTFLPNKSDLTCVTGACGVITSLYCPGDMTCCGMTSGQSLCCVQCGFGLCSHPTTDDYSCGCPPFDEENKEGTKLCWMTCCRISECETCCQAGVQCCCIDKRVALPCDDDVPCICALCGFFCYGQEAWNKGDGAGGAMGAATPAMYGAMM